MYDQGYYLDDKGNRQRLPSKAEMSNPVKCDDSNMESDLMDKDDSNMESDLMDKIEILDERLAQMQLELNNIEPKKILYKDELDEELLKSPLINRLSNEMSMKVNAHRSGGDEHGEFWEGVGGGKRRKKYSKKKKKSKKKKGKSKRRSSKTRRRR
jgi:hypothetical protein